MSRSARIYRAAFTLGLVLWFVSLIMLALGTAQADEGCSLPDIGGSYTCTPVEGSDVPATPRPVLPDPRVETDYGPAVPWPPGPLPEPPTLPTGPLVPAGDWVDIGTPPVYPDPVLDAAPDTEPATPRVRPNPPKAGV